MSECFDCTNSECELGFSKRQAHSFNHLYAFGDFKNLLFRIGWRGPRHKQLLSKGGKP